MCNSKPISVHFEVCRSTTHAPLRLPLICGYNNWELATYYEGNNRSFRHVDAMRVSRSNGVMSDHHSRTIFHDNHFEQISWESSLLVAACSVVDGVSGAGFASLKVVRLTSEIGEVGWAGDWRSVIIGYHGVRKEVKVQRYLSYR